PRIREIVATGKFRAGGGLITWLAGLAVAAVILWPYRPYVLKVRQFSTIHQVYLGRVDLVARKPPLVVLLHNSSIIITLTAIGSWQYLRKRSGRHLPEDGSGAATSKESGGRMFEAADAVRTLSTCGPPTEVNRQAKADPPEQPAVVGHDGFEQLGKVWLIA